ncbi:MAG: peptidoglycan D,D-transpeptidase FtsI family protein [Asticcacaulis sp.]
MPSLRWISEKVWWVEHAFERAKAQARPEEDAWFRIFFLVAFFGFTFGFLALGASKAALFGRDSNLGSGWAGGVPLTARADIVDREGRLLATDLINYRLFVDPTDMTASDRPRVKRALARALPQLSKEKLDAAFKRNGRLGLWGGLTPPEKRRIHELGLPGVTFEAEKARVYPLGTTASHLIGFVAGKEGQGLAGAERALDAEIRQAGSQGRPVALAVDLRIQGALENELYKVAQAHSAIGAVGMVTNVRTGEVLAMASWPDFDPNKAGAYPEDVKRNRAAGALYEMGSIFKVISVAAGLDSGTAALTSTFDATAPIRLGSRQINDYHAENRVMTLEDVFIHSSNIGTTRLADAVGKETMVRYYDQLGLLEAAEIELAESARPILPRVWSRDSLYSSSFGHAISVTPAAMAQSIGAVVNGGMVVPLTIQKVDKGKPVVGRRAMSAATSRQMLDLMRINVVKGTGGKADAPGLRVGGKTGSAEKPGKGGYQRDKLVSSFAAVFPTDNPIHEDRYLVLVMVDEPAGTKDTFGFRTGGWVAAPVAGRVIDRIAPFLGVARKDDRFTTALGEKIVIEETETRGVVP